MNYSILIIDDSEEDRYLLKRYLKKSGLETTIAEVANGEQAMTFLTEFEKYQREHPDMKAPLVVFLDVNMPIMNGWEFLEAYRERQDQVQIKPSVLIMYSTSDQEADMVRAAQFDFVNSYIVKGSYSPEDLKKMVIACTQAA